MNTEKLQLAERLIKEGKLSLEEAMILMDGEAERVKEYVPYPVYPSYPQPYQPWGLPYDHWPVIICTNTTDVTVSGDGLSSSTYIVDASSLDKNPSYAGATYTKN